MRGLDKKSIKKKLKELRREYDKCVQSRDWLMCDGLAETIIRYEEMLDEHRKRKV